MLKCNSFLIWLCKKKKSKFVNYPDTNSTDLRNNGMQQQQDNMAAGYDSDYQVDTLIDFWQILGVIRKWWWLILLVMATIMSIAALFLFRATPVYKSSTILEVLQQERQIVDVGSIDNVIANEEFLTTQIELLKSESLLRDVIESLNLLSDPGIISQEPETTSLPREERMTYAIAHVTEELSVTLVNQSRLIKLSFNHIDPEKASLIANTITDKFIENSLARKFNSTSDAREFLEQRIEIAEASLETSEKELVQYAADNGIIIIEDSREQEASGSLDTAALITLDAELTNAITQRVEAEKAYQQALERVQSSNALQNDTVTALKTEKVALDALYLEKLAYLKAGHPDMIEIKARIDLFDERIADEVSDLSSVELVTLKENYDLARVRESSLAGRVRDLKNSVIDIREKSVDYNILKRQLDTQRAQYDALLQRLREVSISDDIGATLVQVVDRATTPIQPFKPNKLLSMALATVLGGVLGFGLVFGLEIFDDRIKTPEDIKAKLKSITMGVIPLSKNEATLPTQLSNPQSSLSEAYASLRSNLQLSGPAGGPRIIQLTSTRSGEGKSVSSLGLALRYAGLGEKVLLVDADLRLPTFNPGDAYTIGLSGLLTSLEGFDDHIIPTSHEKLDLLPAGDIVPNPSELLSGERFRLLLKHARTKYSYVVIDGPPVLGLADAGIIGSCVDATLLVVEAHQLRTPSVKATMNRLKGSGTKLLGVVLTKFRASGNGYLDYYKYSYGNLSGDYGQVTTKRKKSKAAKKKRKMDLI